MFVRFILHYLLHYCIIYMLLTSTYSCWNGKCYASDLNRQSPVLLSVKYFNQKLDRQFFFGLANYYVSNHNYVIIFHNSHIRFGKLNQSTLSERNASYTFSHWLKPKRGVIKYLHNTSKINFSSQITDCFAPFPAANVNFTLSLYIT